VVDAEDDPGAVGARLRALRLARGWSLAALAARSGRGVLRVSRIELRHPVPQVFRDAFPPDPGGD
jgi:transcriptional regulator with XRE-family HTH domain